MYCYSGQIKAYLVLYSCRSSLAAFLKFRTYVGGSHFEIILGQPPPQIFVAGLHFSGYDLNGLVACSIHGTNLLSKTPYNGFLGSCGVEPQAKDFHSFIW